MIIKNQLIPNLPITQLISNEAKHRTKFFEILNIPVNKHLLHLNLLESLSLLLKSASKSVVLKN